MPCVLRNLAFAVAAALAHAAHAQPELSRVERTIVAEVNRFREEQGLAALKAQASLEDSAARFAEYMARTDKYGHEADGRTPAQRASAHGYDYCLLSENIAYQYSSADFGTAELARRLVEGWKASPGHRRNMLERDALDTAVAVARGAKSGRYYAVQLFGRPRSASIEFRVTNRSREAARYRVAAEEFALSPGGIRIHTRCGPDAVALTGRDADTERVIPAHGDRLTIAPRAGRGVMLRREP